MNEKEILDTATTLLKKFKSRCKKFGGAVAVEIIRDALLAEGFNVSERDVYIRDIPIEIDLLIARQGVFPERRILFRPEDVLVALEIKSRGTFGEQALTNIANNFNLIKNAWKSIECIYVTISERENYKWKATEEKINSPVYTLFWHSGPEDNLNFQATGDWKRFIENVRKIEKPVNQTAGLIEHRETQYEHQRSANGQMMNHFEHQLRQEFIKAVDICINRYGYHPTRFLQMLAEHGPISTAINLVMEPKYHEGFTKLWELKRLDLTVEAIILRAPYNQLFAQEVLERAQIKLDELGYHE